MQSLFETRRTFLATLGAALPSLAVAAGKKGPVANPASIVLILADELPANTLGCYGNRTAKTPNIDALARRGIRFQNALACSRGGALGRAALLSGRTAMQQQAGSNEGLLPDLLAGKGYEVGTAVQFLDRQKAGAKPFFLTVSNPPATALAALDTQVQAVIAKLRERGLEDTTMVVFAAAGGTPEVLQTPLIYSWPGHAPVEASVPDLVGGYDLLFTLCAAADVAPPPGNLCGRSYLTLVQGRAFTKKNPWRSMLYGSFGDSDTVSDNRFKLVMHNDGKGPNQLFDLRADSTKALINQYGNRAFITTRDLMRRSLTQWKTQYSR